MGRVATETASARVRQVSGDMGSLATILFSLAYLAIFLYLLNWFYQAVKRIEKSLQGIEKRLDAVEAGQKRPDTPGPQSNPSPPQQGGAKKMERISNMWGIPAILFIAALLTGGLGLTLDLLYAAGVMLIVAAGWEVVRREVRSRQVRA